MALQVPNENAFDATGGGFRLSRVWFKYFTALKAKLGAAETVAAVASADAATAPAAYNQAHMNTVVAELNETKARLNDVIAALKKE